MSAWERAEAMPTVAGGSGAAVAGAILTTSAGIDASSDHFAGVKIASLVQTAGAAGNSHWDGASFT